MIDEPDYEGVEEPAHDHNPPVESDATDAEGVEDVVVRATGGTWEPVVSPDLLQRFAEMLRPHLPDLRAIINEQFRDALSNVADTIRPQLVGRPQLIDFRKLAPPLLPDLSSIMPKIEFPEMNASLRGLLKQLADRMPPNWPDGADFDLVFKVIKDDGIPLVWVPRADIVADLLAAVDREARIKVLTARSADVVQDCREVLGQITDPDLLNQMPMASSAIEAYAAGHHAPAQALAVAVVETIVTRTIGKYQQARTFAKIDDPKKLTMAELRFRAALAPIGPFYVSWYPSSGDPIPEALSRHVTVHQADPAHYTPGNATVAIMLLASVLRGIQEMLELTRPSATLPSAVTTGVSVGP